MPLASRLRPPVRTVASAVYTIAMIGVEETHAHTRPADDREAIFAHHLARWNRGILRILGVRPIVVGTPPPPPRGARLVVSNHRGFLDVLIHLKLFGGSFLSRGDLAQWPVVGWGARKMKTVFVDRESTRSGAGAIRAIRSRLKEGGTVIVFPEGTTFQGDEVRPFHAGAFAALRGLDVELVPVGIAYPPGLEWWQEGFGAHAGRIASRRRTDVGVCVGEPRHAEGSAKALSGFLHEEVQSLTEQARAALGGTDARASR